ncbi:response regulator [Chryseolinea lacunae]|uniref:Response regulator transcription factor n=1 Tax=Chryseolinea lacunae TaxID=2801331 RepID=A0ABS1KZG1_9BACT|nr:response regulator transcription factor [Chryseolinea lacunae]MBL0744627.1 response regulator transcription factor [Chryseolinea lacunae]
MKILVCDDDVVVLKVIQLALEAEKYDVVLAKDGKQAFQQLRDTTDFDLIITDIHMPYHNGDEILKWVRIEQNAKTPIIMLSSDGEEEVIALALKQGINAFVVKPVNAKDLVKKVNKLLN